MDTYGRAAAKMREKPVEKTPLTVLIVEDEPGMALLARKSVEDAGHRVVVCYTGEEALRRVEKGDIDIALLDYQLPDMTGAEVLERIVRNLPELPVIMVTGRGDETLAVESMKAGAKDYIVKDAHLVYLDALPNIIARCHQQAESEAANVRLRKEHLILVAAIEQAVETIIITDSDGIVHYANPAYEMGTGVKASEAVGNRLQQLDCLANGERPFDKIRESLSTGKVWKDVIVCKKADGSILEQEETISPVFGPNGKLANCVITRHDVTYEKMLHKAREYFTAVTSHEFRMPIVKLQTAQLLLTEFPGKAAEKAEKVLGILSNIREDLNRILSATTLLSDLSKPPGEKHFHPTYLYMDIIACIEKARSAIEEKGRKLELHLDVAALPNTTEILANQVMVMQAIHNILSNAIKYTPDGKSIYVTGKLDGKSALVVVRDEGIGISKEKEPELFIPYFSLENMLYYSTGEYLYKGGGLGLGLALSKMITEYHGGKLQVSSEGENRGTTVTMGFPIVPATVR